MHVLVTRPQHEAEATTLVLREMDLQVSIAPMLDIVPVDPPPSEPRIDDVQVVVLTSANAARALIQRPLGAHLMERDLPVFAVGGATAQAARQAGFGRVINSDGDVDSLIAAIRQTFEPGRGAVLYPCGSHTARDLAEAFARFDLECRPVVVYAAHAATKLARDIERGLRDRRFDLVLFYSARTAGVFAGLLGTYELLDCLDRATALCLSQPVAGRAQALRWAEIIVAPRPDQSAMIAVVRRFSIVRTGPHTDSPSEPPERR